MVDAAAAEEVVIVAKDEFEADAIAGVVVAAVLPLVWALYHPRGPLRHKSILLCLNGAEVSHISVLESLHLQ